MGIGCKELCQRTVYICKRMSLGVGCSAQVRRISPGESSTLCLMEGHLPEFHEKWNTRRYPVIPDFHEWVPERPLSSSEDMSNRFADYHHQSGELEICSIFGI
jgi:hypothetical protein